MKYIARSDFKISLGMKENLPLKHSKGFQTATQLSEGRLGDGGWVVKMFRVKIQVKLWENIYCSYCCHFWEIP